MRVNKACAKEAATLAPKAAQETGTSRIASLRVCRSRKRAYE